MLACLPILYHVYEPVWTEPKRWTLTYHVLRFRWLGRELTLSTLRTAVLALLAWRVAASAAREDRPERRARVAALLPVLTIADLLGAHLVDVPSIAPAYWTEPPLSARILKADPTVARIHGVASRSAGEPGYASEPVDFLSVRDPLGWSLAPVWGLSSSIGETPIIPRRLLNYNDNARFGRGRFDLESVSHILMNRPSLNGLPPGEKAGKTYIFRNPGALPRARLMGNPVYVADEKSAVELLKQPNFDPREHLIVEDPTRPLPPGVRADGSARIISERPERVEIAVEAATNAYLVLADTFDPGWSATRDGLPEPIRPAWVAFRAVHVPRGSHTVIFRYEPAGFRLGLGVSVFGVALALGLLARPGQGVPLAHEHDTLNWPRRWPVAGLLLLTAIVLASTVAIGANGRPRLQPRWAKSVHRFTWGAGIEAMRERRPQ